MILYRARSIGSRPRRLPVFRGNEPYVRIQGRWFTSVKEDAIAYGAATFVPGRWELIQVEVPDAIVDGYRVATVPNTVCGLSPIDYADSPETEYVLPMFRVMDAAEVAMNDTGRVRDYILVDSPRAYSVHAAAARMGVPVVDVPLALLDSADALGVPIEQLLPLAA